MRGPAYAQIHDDLTLDVTQVSDPDAPIKVSAGQLSFNPDSEVGPGPNLTVAERTAHPSDDGWRKRRRPTPSRQGRGWPAAGAFISPSADGRAG